MYGKPPASSLHWLGTAIPVLLVLAALFFIVAYRRSMWAFVYMMFILPIQLAFFEKDKPPPDQ